jgi:hypothetical protein
VSAPKDLAERDTLSRDLHAELRRGAEMRAELEVLRADLAIAVEALVDYASPFTGSTGDRARATLARINRKVNPWCECNPASRLTGGGYDGRRRCTVCDREVKP